MLTLQINGPLSLLVIPVLLASAISISSSIPLIKLLWFQDGGGHRGDLVRQRERDKEEYLSDETVEFDARVYIVQLRSLKKKKEQFIEMFEVKKHNQTLY